MVEHEQTLEDILRYLAIWRTTVRQGHFLVSDVAERVGYKD